MPTPEQLQEWHTVFPKLWRLGDHQKLKTLLSSIETQINELEEDIPTFKAPRNPREDSIQTHSKSKLQMLKKQKERLEVKLQELEKQIETDIEASKNEL